MSLHQLRGVRFVALSFCVATSACGGGTKPADAPTHSSGGARPAASAPSPSPAEATAPPPATAPPSTEPAPPEPAYTRTMSERLFAPTIAYMINYPTSGAKALAERTCSTKFQEEGAKAACMDKARGKFVADVLVFEKSDKGQSFKIYKRAGDSLIEVSSAKIEVDQDTPQGLRVKVLKEKGWRPLFAGKKAFDVRAKDESSIAVDDPQFGVIEYEARIGLLSSGQ